ncbi:Rieske 2Fe-2S domain-containing protein [Novosphingobium sp. FSY-8]|uniref:Rieske 2Fe-2S domain-containing protein n=1 Tax=Novosphingobium ovatum TaxID=1908523 RepID=A0ABW9XC89_9SPHN|nr:aromatic ring-hydroxylating dioxygenase subunit alpha [Novosphingobium ovatum]NBC36145.1 Rieske 2Fe-2S domain-containing protein [Novosphingobium ovatum]
MSYIRNAWYMAAWEEEIVGEALLERRLLDKPWIVLRKQDGDYAMLGNLCPHRFAPLSQGRRQGDTIACPYHGLEFNTAGACTHNPFADLIPPHAHVAAPPVVARHRAVWFWAGDPAAADPALIPDFSAIEVDQPMVHGHMLFPANYELITDNLLDLSHTEYVHADSFQMGGKFLAGEHAAEEDASGAIWSKWTFRNTPRPVWLCAVPDDARMDEWLDMRWHAPASMLLEVGFTLAGAPRDQAPMPAFVNPHILTPETAGTTHYFYTRQPGDEAAAMTRQVFEQEDLPMLAAIQREVGDKDFWALKPVILNVDAAAIRARRRLMQMRRAEMGEA